VKKRKKRWMTQKSDVKLRQTSKTTFQAEYRPKAGKSCKTTRLKIVAGIVKILLAIPIPTV
jgi:hypothetical protein